MAYSNANGGSGASNKSTSTSSELGKQTLIDKSRRDDTLDETFGYFKLNDVQGTEEKIGWLLNTHPVSLIMIILVDLCIDPIDRPISKIKSHILCVVL